MLINIDNKNSDFKRSDLLIAGASGMLAKAGANLVLTSMKNSYGNTVLKSKPMFNQEEEYFKKLVDFTEAINKKHPGYTEFENILKDLKNSGKTTNDLIKSAYSVYNLDTTKNSRNYTDDFLKFSEMTHNPAVSDEKIVEHAKKFLENKKLITPEKMALLELINDPMKRNSFLPLEMIKKIKFYKELSMYSQNVLLNPRLLELTKQMHQENNLQSKGVSHIFGLPEYFKDREKKLIEDNKKLELNILEKFKPVETDSKFQKIYKKYKIKITIKKYKKGLAQDIERNNIYLRGMNASYLSSEKTALVPVLSPIREAMFHELGHAINWNKTKNATKIISFFKSRLPKKALSVAFISSLFLKKSGDDKEKGWIIKSREFVKNNIAAIVLGINIPTLLDEGLASKRAVNFLRNKVTPEQLKRIKIKSINSWGTYLLGAASTALSYKFGIWISEQIQTAKQNKNAQVKN